MVFAVFLAVTLLAVCYPGTASLTLAGLSWLFSYYKQRRQWSGGRLLLGLALAALPVAINLVGNNTAKAQPSLPDLTGFEELFHADRYLNQATLERIYGVSESANPGMDNPQAVDLFQNLNLPSYTAVSLLNLNLEPVVWRGIHFSNDYRKLIPDQIAITFRDGRLYFLNLIPLPSPEEARGFLCVEILFLSSHANERPDTWLGSYQPGTIPYQPVAVGLEESSVLEDISVQLGIEPPPFEIHFIQDPFEAPILDLATCAWAFLFIGGLFFLQKELTPKAMVAWSGVFLLVLGWPRPESLDFMTSFGSYIFGNMHLGRLLSTPFHVLISTSVVFLVLQSLHGLWLQKVKALRIPLTLTIMGMGIAAPGYWQSFNNFSYVHPLEAFQSPGALLSFAAFLAVFVFIIQLLEQIESVPLAQKLPATALGLVCLGWFLPHMIEAGIAFAVIWILKQTLRSTTLKAALVVTAFYPTMVKTEQRAEVQFVKNQVLDEITLLRERNHFRMGRIINRLPNLTEELDQVQHSHMMERFAKSCGLLEDEIDFALRLAGPGGNLVSEISQHISLDQIPYSLGPENRIGVFEPSAEGPHWLVYRKILATEQGDFEFAAVLGNDFQNLSLIRNLRFLDQDRRSSGSNQPYFAYILDVFDLEGSPLYNQRDPIPLTREQYQRQLKDPIFWEVQGRNTLFFFRVEDHIYRVTHKATPLRMIYARYLALLLTVVLLLTLIRLSTRPGRGVLRRWKRSFAFQLAGFMFLSSILPTSLLGYLLINSIQKNQYRGQREVAQSKILAARNLFGDLGGAISQPPVSGLTDEEESDPRPQEPFRVGAIPIQKFARITGEDLSLFVTGNLVKTSQPEVFRQGILPRRLPYDLAKRLHLDKITASYQTSAQGLGIAYCPVELGGNRQGVLAMTMIPYNQRQNNRWLEQLEFSITILLGLLFLMFLLTRFLARSFLNPVSAITKSATRVAKGMTNRPITLHRQDELQRMVEAFNIMQDRIQASQTQLKQQFAILDETLKSMRSGLLGFDLQGNVILQNEKALFLLDLDAHPESLQHLAQRHSDLAELPQALAAGSEAEVTLQLEINGETREIQTKLTRAEAGTAQDLKWILAIEDVTDAFAASRFKAWSEMARRVAHEIKNPLTPIQLEVDHLGHLYRENHSSFGEALEEASEEIRTQVSHLKRIATEFSDYARPLEVHRKPVHLKDLLLDIVEPYHKTLEHLSIETEMPQNLCCHVDERLLRRAVHNLVVNAIDAMDREGTLGLSLSLEQNQIQIGIRDTGPGIPESERRRVFEAYFSTKDQGSGLGLIIANKYIGVHGGTLTIDPTYQQGTRFLISLPLEENSLV